MKFKLNELWFSAVDLLMGNRPFSEMLTFILGLMNFIIGFVVIWTVPFYSRLVIHIIICGGLIILGLTTIATAIVPIKKIQFYIDILSGFVIIYGFEMVLKGIGYRQVFYAFLVIYTMLYVWKWISERVENGYTKISK